MPNLDIHSAVVMAVIVIVLGAILSVWAGVRAIRGSRKIPYFRMARKQRRGGIRTIIFALVLVGVALLIGQFAEPAAYTYFPPSPTLSPTQTISRTPTISPTPTAYLSPTITPTPLISDTPTLTGTPFLPDTVLTQFPGTATPYPDVIFSPLVFSLGVSNYLPVNADIVFENPVKRIFVTYSYDKMSDGAQWTMLWVRGGELLGYITAPWGGGTGGYGQCELGTGASGTPDQCKLGLPADQWLPGTYQVIFFVGTEWKAVGEFRIVGDPPTATPTLSPTVTPTPTLTPTLLLPGTLTPTQTKDEG